MALDSIAFSRLIIISVAILGYIVMVAAYLKHRSKWVFSAYTALVAGAVLLLIGATADLPFLPIIPSIVVAVSAVLFFVSTHQSEQKINEIAEEIQEQRITLGDSQ